MRLELQGAGENNSTWGTLLNTVITLTDSAIAGMATIATTGGSTTLTAVNAAADEARMAIVKVTGALVSNATLVIPAQTKTYVVWNATTLAFSVTIKTSAGTGVVIAQGKKAFIFCDATDCFTAFDDTILSSPVLNEAKGTAVASAATTSDIWAVTGSTVHITGTTGMTGFPAAPQAGIWRKLVYDGAVTLTTGANFIVAGGTRTTAADDIVFVFADTTTRFYLIPMMPGATGANPTATSTGAAVNGSASTFMRSDAAFAISDATATVKGLVPTPPNNTTTFLRGDATFAAVPAATATVSGLVPTPPNNTTTFLRGDATFAAVTSSGITLGTPVASTGGTSIDFTGLPTTVKSITISFVTVSTNGTSPKLIQIGDAGGIETTGYLSRSFSVIAATVAGDSASTGYEFYSIVAGEEMSGSMTLTLENSTANTWVAKGIVGSAGGSPAVFVSGGSKSLSAVLDRVRITTQNGTDTFDLGEINIAYIS